VIYVAEDVIERIIREDVPSLDLTTWTLGLHGQPGTLRVTSREDVVVCGTEEVVRICARLGLTTVTGSPSGTRLGPGGLLVEAHGDVAALHQAWRVSLKVLESCSGIATRTAGLITKARSVAPEIQVLTTRKCFPGAQELSVKAVVAGGGLPHRLGLSETLLAFAQHWAFCGGLEGFLPRIPELRRRLPEKKVLAEVTTLDDARAVAAAGADGVQFDKVPPERLHGWVSDLRRTYPGLVLLAAGGVNQTNADTYAATGVDGLVTSSVYFGPPADLATEITPA
jgi:molybdenum transport protein